MKKVVLFTLALVAASANFTTEAMFLQNSSSVSYSSREEGTVSYKVKYNEYMEAYTVTFYNDTDSKVEITYRYWDDDRWKKTVVVVGRHNSDGGNPAGSEGRIEILSIE